MRTIKDLKSIDSVLRIRSNFETQNVNTTQLYKDFQYRTDLTTIAYLNLFRVVQLNYPKEQAISVFNNLKKAFAVNKVERVRLDKAWVDWLKKQNADLSDPEFQAIVTKSSKILFDLPNFVIFQDFLATLCNLHFFIGKVKEAQSCLQKVIDKGKIDKKSEIIGILNAYKFFESFEVSDFKNMEHFIKLHGVSQSESKIYNKEYLTSILEFNKGNVEAAINNLNLVLKMLPSNEKIKNLVASAYLLKLKVLIYKKDFKEANSLFERLSAMKSAFTDKAYSELIVLSADNQIRQGNFSAAMEIVKKNKNLEFDSSTKKYLFLAMDCALKNLTSGKFDCSGNISQVVENDQGFDLTMKSNILILSYYSKASKNFGNKANLEGVTKLLKARADLNTLELLVNKEINSKVTQ